ncbi:MAG TPA: BlaI/MecI/CopY family transcriptional regulator [Longimicrobium sp.]|jgi:predicted transcriptional regulator|uniref:BlaI/MecI/CopY family transcriptional regulator n=1 Tax=Longimicrobium sp. TaxID=2029185 RepID=UPI002ED8AA1B
MAGTPPLDLGRRERQIMEVVYRLGRASASEVRAALADPPSYSAVRGMLRLLEDKGHLSHAQDGIRHVYFPTVAQDDMRESAMKHVVRTFFAGSVSAAMASLLETTEEPPSDDELDALSQLIAQAREQGR